MLPGARHLAMGEVGGGLLDKKYSYFYNSALPGILNIINVN